MRPNYDDAEVRALVEEYAAHKARVDTTPGRLNILTRLADLHRAMELLPVKYWEVVLLHGLIGLTQEETARVLKISQQAVSKRYRKGIEDIVYNINGGLY